MCEKRNRLPAGMAREPVTCLCAGYQGSREPRAGGNSVQTGAHKSPEDLPQKTGLAIGLRLRPLVSFGWPHPCMAWPPALFHPCSRRSILAEPSRLPRIR